MPSWSCNAVNMPCPPTRCFLSRRLAMTPAAEHKTLISMDGLYLLGFGPRTARAARDLAIRLYPTSMPAIFHRSKVPAPLHVRPMTAADTSPDLAGRHRRFAPCPLGRADHAGSYRGAARGRCRFGIDRCSEDIARPCRSCLVLERRRCTGGARRADPRSRSGCRASPWRRWSAPFWPPPERSCRACFAIRLPIQAWLESQPGRALPSRP